MKKKFIYPNVTKIGKFSLRNDESNNKIKIEYFKSIKEGILKDNAGRVYLFFANNEIMKIGGSMSKGGIKSTMSFYTDSQQGNPGPNRFCIHLLIEEELKKQKNVELGLVMNKKIKAETMGLKSKKNIYVSAFKESEDFCKQEYHEFYGKYPPWNFQENGTKYPSRLIKLHNEYIKKRI